MAFDGEDVAPLTPSQRGIGLVFQNYALYPHFRVRGNIAFYFRLRRWASEDIDIKVQETSRIMGIGFDKLLGRFPRSLSGGEKQRVALARCLSHSPRVLLLDEPFSNLDASLRLQTRGEVKRLVDRFGLTTVFVTHDQNEAVAMGHRVAVMRQGQIEQVGTYLELYREPVNAFVAGFLGSPPMHLVAGRRAGDAIACEVSGTQLLLPFPEHYRTRVADGEPVTIGLRPEHLRLTSAGEAQGCRARWRWSNCRCQMRPTSCTCATVTTPSVRKLSCNSLYVLGKPYGCISLRSISTTSTVMTNAFEGLRHALLTILTE